MWETPIVYFYSLTLKQYNPVVHLQFYTSNNFGNYWPAELFCSFMLTVLTKSTARVFPSLKNKNFINQAIINIWQLSGFHDLLASFATPIHTHHNQHGGQCYDVLDFIKLKLKPSSQQIIVS